MEPIKLIVASNLAELRKSKGMTQQELAEKFCYSDKSISKWEHGETLPDIETLKHLCDFYGVTLDYLTSERSMAEKQIEFAKQDSSNITSKRLIVALAISVVWILATVIFVGALLTSNMVENGETIALWTSFVWAVPISILVLIIFNRKWGSNKWSSWLVVTFIWTLTAATYIQAGNALPDKTGWILIWPLFIVGIPLTIAVFLFGKLKNKKGK